MICQEPKVEVFAPYSGFLVSEDELVAHHSGASASAPVLPRLAGPGLNEEPAFISIRDAARRLGVHENTVRNWLERGLLEFVRLPGSGYRRLAQADVERLRGGMRFGYAQEFNAAERVDAGFPKAVYQGNFEPASREELSANDSRN